MLGFVAALVAAVVLIIYFEQRSSIRRNGKKLPRPPGAIPLAGYGLWFLQPRHKLLAWFAEIQPTMGLATYELPVPSLPPAILVNDPKNLEYVLKEINLFMKGHFFQSRSWDLFGNGIVNADGEIWRAQRKAGLQFLSNANLRHFMDDMLPTYIDDMRRRLDAASTSGATIDLQEELLRVTTRLFGKVAYDTDIDPSMPFSDAFEFASAKTHARFTNPFWRIEATLFGRKFRAAVAEVRALSSAVVAAASAQLQDEKANSSQTSLVKALLTSIPDHETVANSVTNFLSAGRDTTAQTMAWTMYETLRHPNETKRCVESLKATFPNQKRSEPPTIGFEEASNPRFLTHIAAFFAESLRLNAAIPFEFRETSAPCVLPDGTEVPSGCAVIWIPYALARSPHIWGADAAQFVPERWIVQDDEGQDVIMQKSAFEHPVFNGGPRMCIGKRMAEVLAVKVLSELLWRWEFTLATDKPRVMGESLTGPMLGGLPVTVRRVADDDLS